MEFVAREIYYSVARGTRGGHGAGAETAGGGRHQRYMATGLGAVCARVRVLAEAEGERVQTI